MAGHALPRLPSSAAPSRSASSSACSRSRASSTHDTTDRARPADAPSATTPRAAADAKPRRRRRHLRTRLAGRRVRPGQLRHGPAAVPRRRPAPPPAPASSIDNDGHIVTNDHVVEGATQYRVRIGADGRRRSRPSCVGKDPSSDLAVLKVDPSKVMRRPASRSQLGRLQRARARATRRSPSARRSASRARSRAASSPRSGARSRRPTASRSPTRSRPTPRSTPATPAARCSTAAAA